MSIFNNLFGKKQEAAGASVDEAVKAFLKNIIGEEESSSDTSHYTPKGKFGYDRSNPIMTNGISREYAYLNTLERDDGSPITYNRVGSLMSGVKELPRPMDCYHIFDEATGEQLATLFLYAYSHELSTQAPSGFRFKQQ